MPKLIENDEHLEEPCQFLTRDPSQNILGSFSLQVAVKCSKSENRVVQKLINAGAGILLTSCEGGTPLHHAVISRNRVAVEALIQVGAKINSQNSLGRTALHYSVHTSQTRRYKHFPWMYSVRCAPDLWIMKKVLDQGEIEVNPVDSKGETPLMWAVKHKKFEAVKLLLKKGANPNISNHHAQNCLHVALSERNLDEDIVIELLRYGVNIYDADNSSLTPIDLILRSVYDKPSLCFANECVDLIAFKYHIRKELMCKLEWYPKLARYLKAAVPEIEQMSGDIIYDKVNLHDFASNCYHERNTGDPTLEIYKPVVEILLSGKYEKYLRDILFRISKQELCNVLKIFTPPALHVKYSVILENFPGHTYHEMFRLIQTYAKVSRKDKVEHPIT